MSVLLTLPTELDPEELIPYDTISIYRREGPYHFFLVSVVSLGTETYTDSSGRVDDEYHIKFTESATGVQSLPSGIIRILEPYKDRNEEGAVVVTFELDTVPPIPTVDLVGIYRRKPDEDVAIRIATVAIGTARYQDPDGVPGDIYHSTFIDTTNSAESQPSEYHTAGAGSGLVIVSGRFEDVSGNHAETFNVNRPDVYRDIEIYLKVPSNSNYITPTARGQVIGIESSEAYLDDQGRWSVALIPNDLILPSRSYYMFVYRGVQMFKRIDSQYGQVQNFALLPDADPEVEGRRFLGRNF